jgi:hypothetical protein
MTAEPSPTTDVADPNPTTDDAPGPADGSGGVGALVARLTGPAGDSRERRRDLRALAGAVVTSARAAGRASVIGGGWLVDLLVDTVPRIPVRDLATLRAHHPGLEPDDLAQALIAGAAKGTAAVGAAGGALVAVEFAAPPTLLSLPAQLAAETLLVAAIEIKLIAELHEVYGAGITGSTRSRTQAYLSAWTHRRGIDPLSPGALSVSLGSAAKRSLRKRLVRRAGRNLSTVGPMLSGAVAGSAVNHRETRRLGDEVRDDLRQLIRG